MASAHGIRHSRRVPGRTSKLALAAGFAVVLALAVGLVQLTRGTAPGAALRGAVAPAHAPTPSAREPVAEHPAPRPAPGLAREQRAVASAPGSRSSAGAAPPELAVAPAGFDRELKRDASGKLVPMITVKELKEQLHLTDAPMAACIERSGQRPTGKATLSFTVAARNRKLVVETTGVQDEDTLGGYPELLECLHRTATVLVPEGHAVPELGTAIYVRRHVRIENGVLAENLIFNFSYNP